jgi:hypothetical protein
MKMKSWVFFAELKNVLKIAENLLKYPGSSLLNLKKKCAKNRFKKPS